STEGDIGDGKLDYRFTNALTGFMRYGISHYNSTDDSLFGPVIGGPTRSGLRNHHASISVVGNYNGIIAELRGGYSRYRNAITDDSQSGAFARQLAGLNFGAGTGLPSINITGLGTLGMQAGLPAKDLSTVWEGGANFHILRGRQQIKFGMDMRDNQS